MGTHYWQSRNSNPISSKGGLHSIESSIVAEAKIANLMRRIEALETKEPAPVNQVSPSQSKLRAAHAIKWWTMCSKSVQFFLLANVTRAHECDLLKALQQFLLAKIQSRLEKSPIFLMEQTTMAILGPVFLITSISQLSTKFFQPSYTLFIPNPPAEKKLTDLEKNMETLIKPQHPSYKIWDNCWVITLKSYLG